MRAFGLGHAGGEVHQPALRVLLALPPVRQLGRQRARALLARLARPLHALPRLARGDVLGARMGQCRARLLGRVPRLGRVRDGVAQGGGGVAGPLRLGGVGFGPSQRVRGGGELAGDGGGLPLDPRRVLACVGQLPLRLPAGAAGRRVGLDRCALGGVGEPPALGRRRGGGVGLGQLAAQRGQAVALLQPHGGGRRRPRAHAKPVPAPDLARARDQRLAGAQLGLPPLARCRVRDQPRLRQRAGQRGRCLDQGGQRHRPVRQPRCVGQRRQLVPVPCGGGVARRLDVLAEGRPQRRLQARRHRQRIDHARPPGAGAHRQGLVHPLHRRGEPGAPGLGGPGRIARRQGGGLGGGALLLGRLQARAGGQRRRLRRLAPRHRAGHVRSRHGLCRDPVALLVAARLLLAQHACALFGGGQRLAGRAVPRGHVGGKLGALLGRPLRRLHRLGGGGGASFGPGQSRRRRRLLGVEARLLRPEPLARRCRVEAGLLGMGEVAGDLRPVLGGRRERRLGLRRLGHGLLCREPRPFQRGARLGLRAAQRRHGGSRGREAGRALGRRRGGLRDRTLRRAERRPGRLARRRGQCPLDRQQLRLGRAHAVGQRAEPRRLLRLPP